MRGRVRGEHGGQDTWRGHVQAAPGPGHVWQQQSQQQQRVAVAVGRRLGAVCAIPLEVKLDTNLREYYSFTITEAPPTYVNATYNSK